MEGKVSGLKASTIRQLPSTSAVVVAATAAAAVAAAAAAASSISTAAPPPSIGCAPSSVARLDTPLSTYTCVDNDISALSEPSVCVEPTRSDEESKEFELVSNIDIINPWLYLGYVEFKINLKGISEKIRDLLFLLILKYNMIYIYTNF